MGLELPPRFIQPRCRRIERLLAPLRGGAPLTCSIASGAGSRGVILVAHEGPRPDLDHGGIRFRLAAGRLRGNYFEVWRESAGSRGLELQKAYLTLFQLLPGQRLFKELLAVHCDPSEGGNEPMRSFKRGPHLHVLAASQPIPKCHFPLNLGELEVVLNSIEELQQAWERVVKIMKAEVIERFLE